LPPALLAGDENRAVPRDRFSQVNRPPAMAFATKVIPLDCNGAGGQGGGVIFTLPCFQKESH
jgi:hypothetical protein